jgi:hypothetical protein
MEPTMPDDKLPRRMLHSENIGEAPMPPPTDPDLPPIPAGKARLALASALLNMHQAVYQLEATATAIARALDAGEAT